MAYNAFEQANQLAAHDLINISIYPDRPMRLGQKDAYRFRDAEIAMRRTGNAYGIPKDATTVVYKIIGDGFFALLHAVWTPGCCTADVEIKEVLPESDGHKSFNLWLRGTAPEEERAGNGAYMNEDEIIPQTA